MMKPLHVQPRMKRSIIVPRRYGMSKRLTVMLLVILAPSLPLGVPSGVSEVTACDRTAPPQTPSLTETVTSNGSVAGHTDFDGLLRRTLPRFHLDASHLSETVRQKLSKRLHSYTVLHRQATQTMLHRAAPHLRFIERILQQHDLPFYFAYIPMAESAFRKDVTNPKSGARGLWQLLANTARGYGLRVSDRIDERLDPYRATQAAARYLRELQDIFGKESPLLILSAYNFGETKLSKAILRLRSRDIWKLYQARQIPSQTRQYLLDMMVFWLVVSHAEHYQFTMLPDTTQPLMPFTEIMFPRELSLSALAQRISLSEQQLRTLNPSVLGAQIPAGIPIRVPFSRIEKSLHDEVRLALSFNEWCCDRRMTMENCWYTVKSGDTLYAIAKRHNVRLEVLKSLNQLKGDHPIIHPDQRLLVCPAAPTAAE